MSLVRKKPSNPLQSYMRDYMRMNSPNASLVETIREERVNYQEKRRLETQAQGLIRFIEKIRRDHRTDRHRIHTLSEEQIIFLKSEGLNVVKSDRMKDGEDCFYVFLQ